MTGADIRTARLRAGESQAKFAERIGVSQVSIHRWETDGPPETGPARILLEATLAEISQLPPSPAPTEGAPA